MNLKRFISVVLSAALLFTLLSATLCPVSAAPLDRNGSITLHVVTSSGKPLEGATFRLYQFANAYTSGFGVRYEFIPPYDRANISIDNLQDSYLPVHLTGFAITRSLPYVEKSADKDGLIVFEDLTPGLYLIVPYSNFNGYYMPAPFIINIPEFDSGSHQWEYDIIATPKMVIIDGNANTQTTYISVQKKWETDEKPPESVTVVLLRDLEVIDRVQLSESNGWYYRWDSLPKNYVWNVVEEQVPDGFEVQYESSSNTVTIINKAVSAEETTTGTVTETQPVTRPGETEPGQTLPGETTLPSQDGTTVPGETHPGETTTKPEELIDTGQLNWPVPIMAIAGLVLFSIGWSVLNFGKKETE